MEKPGISITLPSWTQAFMQREIVCRSDNEKMSIAIELARMNISNKTGGPFGAAIFEYDTGKLLAVGMNLVTTSNCSVCHAEIVAIICAQKEIGSFDLSSTPIKYELATSTEPCAMCLGAIPWSGLYKIICGATDTDAREIGFDEGAKPADWIAELEKRNIEVITDVLREQARDVLKEYVENGGLLYNPSSG